MIRLASLGLLVVFLLPMVADAASLYLSPNTSTLYRGDSQRYTVRLDVAADECVNAVDAVISYTENIEPVDTSTGGSIFSMWVEEPTINRDERTITFAGGIPNGYCGRIDGDPRLTNALVDIIFQSPGFTIGSGGNGTSSDEAIINFRDETTAYLNDGFGTQIPIATYGATINLERSAGVSVQNDWLDYINNDTEAPNPFSITLEQSPNAFSNDYFITFNTSDKQSGVSYYEVMEEPLQENSLFRWGGVDAPWEKTRSPYVLQDQSLNSKIFVRAVDKAGNEYMAVLVPDESLRSVSINQTLIYTLLAALLVLSVVGIAVFFLWRRRRHAVILDNK